VQTASRLISSSMQFIVTLILHSLQCLSIHHCIVYYLVILTLKHTCYHNYPTSPGLIDTFTTRNSYIALIYVASSTVWNNLPISFFHSLSLQFLYCLSGSCFPSLGISIYTTFKLFFHWCIVPLAV